MFFEQVGRPNITVFLPTYSVTKSLFRKNKLQQYKKEKNYI